MFVPQLSVLLDAGKVNVTMKDAQYALSVPSNHTAYEQNQDAGTQRAVLN